MLIGVFHARNPLSALSRQRISTIVEEARLQHADLIFFNDVGIDPLRKQVTGQIPGESGWTPAVRPYPDVIINDLPGDKNLRSERELAMRYDVPFTTARLYGKMFFARQLLQSPVLSPFIVPTQLLKDISAIDELFQRFDRLVLKPDSGRKGQGIYSLTRRNGTYSLRQGQQSVDYDRAGIEEQVRLLADSQPFLVQPYIRCVTEANEPFDFRVLAQRDGRGHWAIARVYPRIGLPGTVTSNVAQGGRVEELHTFVSRTFPQESPELVIHALHRVGLAFVEEISTLFAFPINELGLDLAIDADGRMWFYEANASPATKYEHQARAVRTIEYARYLANAFQPKYGKPESGTTIGLLVKDKPSPAFLTACSNAAAAHGADIVYITPHEAGPEDGNMVGFRRVLAEWKQTAMACPEVICDLLQERDNPEYARLYESLSQAAFTSETADTPAPLAAFWQAAAEDTGLQAAIPETGAASRSFIDRHPAVLLKPRQPAPADKTILIRRHKQGYRLYEPQHTHELSPAELDALLPLLRSKGFAAQQWLDSSTEEGHSYLLLVFLMKAGTGTWETAAKMPLIAINPLNPPSNRLHELPPMSSYEVFMKDEFGEDRMDRLDSAIEATAMQAAALLDKLAAKRFNQVCFDFAVSPDGRVWLQDVRGRWPLPLYHVPAVARMTVSCALSLANAGRKLPGGALR